MLQSIVSVHFPKAVNGPLLSLVAGRAFPDWFEAWHRRRAFQDACGRGQWGAESGTVFSALATRRVRKCLR